VPATGAIARPLTISNLRAFLEHPIQAWAQAVLGLDELPDDSAAEHSDEPFHLTRAERARVLREVFAAHLREPGRPLEERYDAYVADLTLRGQFPVGVFAEAARALDLRLLEEWRAALGPVAVGAAVRFGFGRASSPGAELRPALVLELSGGRTVRLVGQTELMLRGEVLTSVVPVLRKADSRSPYHLRGALDHLVLAATGLAPGGHAHVLLDGEGQARRVEHRPWAEDEARAFLAALASELVEDSHGYLLPFEALAKALGGGKAPSRFGDPTGGLGFGPIERRDGLEPPEDAAAIAHRRLRPLVERMLGDHGFEDASAARSEGRR
jgi:hypothetical protein